MISLNYKFLRFWPIVPQNLNPSLSLKTPSLLSCFQGQKHTLIDTEFFWYLLLTFLRDLHHSCNLTRVFHQFSSPLAPVSVCFSGDLIRTTRALSGTCPKWSHHRKSSQLVMGPLLPWPRSALLVLWLSSHHFERLLLCGPTAVAWPFGAWLSGGRAVSLRHVT